MRTIVSAAAAILLLVGASPARSDVLYRSAQVLEERVGRIELRRAYGTQLQVLLPCKEDPGGCVEESTYDEVLRIDFFSVGQEVKRDSPVATEEPAGTIYLATHFDDEDRAGFGEELERTLRGLPADAFDKPFAGLGPMRAPFDRAALSTRAILPSWACFFADGTRPMTVRFTRHVDGDGLVSAGATRFAQSPTTVCDGIKAATEGAHAEVFRTLSSPSLLREWVVEHADVITLDTRDARWLPERPPGVQLVKQERPSSSSFEGSSQAGDGSLSRATYGAHGWRFDAWAEPISIPVSSLDENAWLHALTVSTVEREFGAHSNEKLVGRTVVLAAYLATVPAAQLTGTSPDGSIPVLPSGHLAIEVEPSVGATPPRIERTAFIEQLIDELDSQGGAVTERVLTWLGRPETGLESEGWLVVICQGGDARYFVPPTKASNQVTNADVFCADLESLLN